MALPCPGSLRSDAQTNLNLELTKSMGFWNNAIDHLFVGPMVPATILMMLSAVYLVVSLLGFFGGELDVDADMDVGGPVVAGPELAGPELSGPEVLGPDLDGPSAAGLEGGDVGVDPGGEAMSSDWLGGIGAATLRAVNLDRVPLMLWFSTFSVLLWVITYVLWFEFDAPNLEALGSESSLVWSAWLIVRNAVLAVLGTRVVTRPLHRLLQPERQFHSGTLVGGAAVVETSQVDSTFGRARYPTGAAPLLIRIRTRGETLQKGTLVDLVDYDATAKEYIVAAATAASMS
ncbi:MAG: DUF1449 domain-containing protein [Planctomycetota bacterium]